MWVYARLISLQLSIIGAAAVRSTHPLPHRAAPHRTAPHRTRAAPHRTAPHRTAPHPRRTAPHPHRTAPHRAAPHRTRAAPRRAAPRRAAPHRQNNPHPTQALFLGSALLLREAGASLLLLFLFQCALLLADAVHTLLQCALQRYERREPNHNPNPNPNPTHPQPTPSPPPPLTQPVTPTRYERRDQQHRSSLLYYATLLPEISMQLGRLCHHLHVWCVTLPLPYPYTTCTCGACTCLPTSPTAYHPPPTTHHPPPTTHCLLGTCTALVSR